MPFVFKRLALLLSIAMALAPDKAPAADKDHPKFEIAPASSYPSHQTGDKVTIGASVFDSADKAHTAFGKLNPYQYGIVPILVVIQNDSGQTLRLDHMKVDYVASDGGHVDATPAEDVKYLNGPNKPNVVTGPIPTRGPHVSRHKNPLNAWEIEGRAFSAKVIPPAQSAGGFFYFQSGHSPGARLYITGITQASTGRELLYFEFPLKEDPK